MITVKQCKAARALLEWRQHHLAKAASVEVSAIGDWESRRKPLIQQNMDAVITAMELAGIVFIGMTGVDLPEKPE